MMTRTFAAVIGAAMMVAIGATDTQAQAVRPGAPGSTTEQAGDAPDPNNRNERRSPRGRRAQQPEAPSPEVVKASAQGLATAAGTRCQVSEAVLLGQTAESQSLYEVACGTEPGLILTSGLADAAPTAVTCLELDGGAQTTRMTDPAADVGLQCKIPANTQFMTFISGYAQAAGVPCTLDQGAAIGKASDGTLIYEVGCAGQIGYRLEQKDGAWAKSDCLLLASSNVTCRFTTPDERHATVKTWLAGTAASECEVQDARVMGVNPRGTFYEAKCAAGDGYVFVADAAMAVQNVYACPDATLIGGGCKLTTVAAAPAAAAPATE